MHQLKLDTYPQVSRAWQEGVIEKSNFLKLNHLTITKNDPTITIALAITTN